jgi:hypothetical protein
MNRPDSLDLRRTFIKASISCLRRFAIAGHQRDGNAMVRWQTDYVFAGLPPL